MANINDLATAVANIMSQKGYDSGDPSVAIGLKREAGNPITDSRVMDGFSARFHGNHLISQQKILSRIFWILLPILKTF
jgi:thiamine kinase-like enzyme